MSLDNDLGVELHSSSCCQKTVDLVHLGFSRDANATFGGSAHIAHVVGHRLNNDGFLRQCVLTKPVEPALDFHGVDERVRTSGLGLRRPALCPAELHRHGVSKRIRTSNGGFVDRNDLHFTIETRVGATWRGMPWTGLERRASPTTWCPYSRTAALQGAIPTPEEVGRVDPACPFRALVSQLAGSWHCKAWAFLLLDPADPGR